MLLFIFTSARELLRTASAKWHPTSGDDHVDSAPPAHAKHISGRLSLVIRPVRARYGVRDPYHH